MIFTITTYVLTAVVAAALALLWCNRKNSRFKNGGVVELPPTPAPVIHVTTVEVKFTDLSKLPIFRVLKRDRTAIAGWRVVGYTDRQRDLHEFLSDPTTYRVETTWGYRAPGAGFNNLFMLNKVEAAPRVPTLID